MSKTDKLKEYNVSKRFTIWVETNIKASNMHEAVDKAEAMKPQDFAEFENTPNDWEPLPGTSVSENW